ncbi:DMT family transporter [Xenorhabdus nematophila]|uniref:Threonine/homoserine exporter RhtA n=1 Tax=Xenorhabdus nematophila (strain ATCC 19061 / DSM 3370 / CCUG 14189 / LMG 1036 / NCIMB 9965 / AN6) TaxID=406817 RepID=D3VKW4_XENNA|nr:DMT family transporter [Xenorhabdus nematophila]CEE94113.1 putative membrane protein [Xenorhabdus nematophila str. Anatoliense]CEF28542.1 putative membrane protein [Xenorhabdus nematophila str. Websteri]AYA39780.1 DMT family transporter [Xenorhabdus nematophila]KHD27742.1 multidrug DMT transporter [Xenorhabdus nematophila]MBA0018347.1 DMT family transporter [Xenorhabdus nematophila]
MKNLLFPLIAVLIWSINAVVCKAATTVIEPASIVFYRWFIAFLTLTPFVLLPILKQRKLVAKYWWKLFILSLLGMVLNQSLAYYAAHTVSATLIGIFTSLIPLLTVILSIFSLRATPTVGITLGTVLSLFGLVWLVSKGEPASLLQHGLGIGEIMMFIAAASYALYGVLTKRWAIPLPNWQSLYVQIAFGALLLLPNFMMTDNVQLTSDNISLVLFAGIPASIIAPYLWIQSVIRIGANMTAIFMNLAPVFTAIIAILVLHEQMHSYHIIGGGIVLAGVIIAQQLRTPLTRRKPKYNSNQQSSQ